MLSTALSFLEQRCLAQSVEHLQNWPDRGWFYTFNQGSRLLPYEWFIHLEMPDNQSAFIADGLARYGYIPGDADNLPDKLPIGFAKDSDQDGGDCPALC